MAKASQEEIDSAIRLAHLTEEVCHPKGYSSARFPDTDDEEGGFFDADSFDDLKRFFETVKKHSDGLMRVAFGYQVLVDNCCDPDADTLEWKPGIIVPKKEEVPA